MAKPDSPRFPPVTIASQDGNSPFQVTGVIYGSSNVDDK
jgi:hypothetical protein